MSDKPHKPPDSGLSLADHVGNKADRKIRARRNPRPGIWFGLGMLGLIGWSVALPTLLGVALGVWLDAHYPAGRSWTLALLVAGLLLGCFNAWHWLSWENRTMHDEEKKGGKKEEGNE